MKSNYNKLIEAYGVLKPEQQQKFIKIFGLVKFVSKEKQKSALKICERTIIKNKQNMINDKAISFTEKLKRIVG